MLREAMSSAEHLKELVRGKLEAAAEEIFAVVRRVVVDYEEELDRHRKFFVAACKPVVKLQRAELPQELVRGKLEAAAEEIFAVVHQVFVDYEVELVRHRKFFEAAFKPVVKLHRTELPQQVVIKEEVIVEDQAPLIQDKNSSQDQEQPEPPQLEEQQEEESSLELRLKQEPEELQLCSAEVESHKSEDQSVDWHSEESDIKVVVITSVGSEANSDLQLCSLSAGVSTNGAQKEGSEVLTQTPCKSQRVSTKDHENPGLGSSSCGTSLQHEVMRKKYVCQECGKMFSLKSNLNRHKIKHTGEKPYVCQTCGKRFSGPSHLKVHKLIHTGEKPYACDTCDSRFLRLEALKIHTRVHTGERPYACNTCDSRFMRQEALTRHKTIHSANNPHVCQKCGMRFSLMSALTRHGRIHADEKTHVCDTCDKRFSRLEYLKIHARVHTGVRLPSPHRLYVCKTCDQSFSTLETYNTHTRSHADERPYVCSKCGSDFATTTAIQYHVRTAH